MQPLLKIAVLSLLAGSASAQAPAQTAPSVGNPHRKMQTQQQQDPATRPQVPAAPQAGAPTRQGIAPAQVTTPPAQSPSVQPAVQSPAVQSQVQMPTVQPQVQSPAPEPKVPVSAPRVSFQNGQLTVLAENSSLGEVLNAVRAATGIRVEGASGGSERVTAKIGPAPVRDVLLSLLEGSRYDFAMLGAATDPQRVERLVLSPRLAPASGTYAAVPQQPPQGNSAIAQPVSPGEEDDNEGFAEPAKPALATPAGANPANPQVKTPEQLLEDLKKIEADKAQQQQQQVQPGQPVDPNTPRPTRPERPK